MGKAPHRYRRNLRDGLRVPCARLGGRRARVVRYLGSDATTTEKALTAFTWATWGQFFWDGNKRSGMALANKILISGGAGILTITDKHMEQFNTLLLDYYNTGNGDALKSFLYDNAIQGMSV